LQSELFSTKFLFVVWEATMEDDAPNRLPDLVLEVLAYPDRFDLLSLDPSDGYSDEDSGFQGWRVLGITTIESPETRREVVEALQRGIAENQDCAAECFIPRHGIRVVRGDSSVDLVVCFECAQAYVYYGDEMFETVLVSDSPKPVFDRVLTAARVKLAGKYP
jgi:hypothetical protein